MVLLRGCCALSICSDIVGGCNGVVAGTFDRDFEVVAIVV